MSGGNLLAVAETTNDTRYVCTACGNRTRFDVTDTVRRVRFHHYTLGGELTVEEERVLERTVESVTCRWCDRADSVEPLTDH